MFPLARRRPKVGFLQRLWIPAPPREILLRVTSLWQAAENYLFSRSGWSVVLQWWALLLIPGLLALPWTARLSDRRFDAAYPLAKAIGWVLPALAIWLLSSLHVVPFARPAIFGAIAVQAVVAAILAWRDREHFRGAKFWRFVLLEEALFLFVLSGFGLLRYIRPDLVDIEKYMNFAFVNASLRTATMPPIDPWYALEPMNYYYFGHYWTAYQIKLGGFAPAVGYNLMFATLPAMAFVLAFSIVANAVATLRRRITGSRPLAPLVAGLVSAVVLVAGGNLHSIVYGVLQPMVGAVAKPPDPAIFSGGMKDPRPYIWSDPRSFIGYNPETDDKTITEFPAYAFILGDLHAHVINLVFVLALLGIALLFLCRNGGRFRDDLPFVLLFGLMLGLFVLTNTWDFPIYLGLTLLVLVLRRPRNPWSAGLHAVVAAAIALAIASPLLRHFHPSAKEICFSTTRTPLWQLAIVWGVQVVMIVLFAVGLGRQWRKDRRLEAPDAFFAACLLIAAVCITVPEIVYFKDIFEERWPRAITMFKFSFQGYALAAVASGYVAWRILGWVRAGATRQIAGLGLGLWLALPLEFFDLAIPGYYLSQPGSPGLDGLRYLEKQYPEDAAIIEFLNREAGPGNVLEATGEPYAHTSRISVATGRPTILGWWLHERLWRNEPGSDPVEIRRRAVLDIYGPADPVRTRQLLDQYRIRYIVLAPEERKVIPRLDEDKLRSLARTVFKQGSGEVLEYSGNATR